MKLFTSLTALLMVNIVFAQNAQQAIRDAWKEKTEWRQKALQQAHPGNGGTADERSSSNVLVDHTSTEIQSEVHAAINPTDSNNIVVSSNFVSTNQTAFATCTNFIYYTNDFGNTWSTSSFLTAPVTPNPTILGGGDPNFAFDDQGKLYFSWINLWADAGFNVTWDLFWSYSLDGGNVWKRDSIDDHIGSTPSSFFGGGGAFDKEWLASDNTPSSPNYHNVYCSFFGADGNTGATFMGLRRKTPTTGVFDTATAIVNSGTYKAEQFGSDAVDNNGNVHVTFFASVDSLNYSLVPCRFARWWRYLSTRSKNKRRCTWAVYSYRTRRFHKRK